MLALVGVFLGNNQYLFLVGPLGETACKGDSLAQGEAGLEVYATGLFNLAVNEERAVLNDAHRDARDYQVIRLEAGAQGLLHLHGGIAGDLELAQKGVVD